MFKQKQPEAPRPKTRVKILQGVAGNADPAHGLTADFMFGPGQVTLLDSELAAAWISSGIAEAVQ